MSSLFSKLPNDLIMKIIKINTIEEEKDRHWRRMYGKVLYELQYEWGDLRAGKFNVNPYWLNRKFDRRPRGTFIRD